ncbi:MULTISPECIES: leucine-rich repeat domain-containing protein [Nostoc]|uniref:non-specific serine/threonine protein kinase n=2 Tax=Nostoc TaxID=1177 RepID=A0ABR8IDC8_9NOSO|nr:MULTISPECIES: leucine-rich repeat domain-containing protein [Nostoc]MBD2562385.1 leucine-rich repeat domain-containing protein [Nostoc linckia FACHB-391]MBD2648942.1 leucine-rich repeat domain-containing protein [Nostoc foliaceum FACHB-393]
MTNEELLQIIEQAVRDKVTELDLSFKSFTTLPAEIGRLSNLRSLNLSFNQLRILPAEIGQLSNLRSLNLNFNQLSNLPGEFGQLTNLQSLNLSRNQLSSLPREIGQLANLQSLYLYSNQLSNLPREIVQLTNLQSFDLRGNQLSSLPAEIVQLANLQTLHLSVNQLSSLPAKFGQLTNLKYLYLSGNQLSSLPAKFGQLTNLQYLYLSGNQLSSLPAEIAQLTNLQYLDLSRNQLNSLPAEFGQLTNLQSLDLYNNQLNSLPAEIGQLTNLQYLDLRFNQLNSLPAEIGQLTNLQSLDLYNNQLNSLPAEIGQLTNLQYLDLYNNQLSSLPAEFGQLTNLISLHLSNNQLSSLPPEIVQLTNLQYLDFYNNQLSSLPPEIVQLTNLQSLYLGSNKLSTLPAEIVQLTNLQSLYLSGNQLSSLPPEFGQLPNLKKLDLRRNPLPIPPEILGSKNLSEDPGDVNEILDFYFRVQDPTETEPFYEVKFLIVGEGGAGKTSLAKKISDETYELQADEESTEGIEVIRWDFILPNGKDFRVNIWDFGGQEIYHQTHQFFLSKRSLYALVADTRKENTDFYWWLKVVELLSDKSPVIIIKNEKQGRQCEVDGGQLRGEFDNLKEILATNLADNRGLAEIKKVIQLYITNLDHVGTPLPKLWVRVRAALENDSRNYISFEEYCNLCRVNNLTDRKDMLRLSSYLHDLGICLHFQDDSTLKHYVILKPEWGTTAVYKVLDSQTVKQELGCFTKENLKDIWQDDEYADMRDELLQLMMRFKLCYEIRDRRDIYIAPQLLSIKKANYTWDDRNNLILRYTYTFMPKGILTRFIVETHPWIEQQKLVWKNGVVLHKDQTRAEIIENYNQREIKIRVAGNRKKELMAVITYELEKIHNSYERLQYQTLVPCNCEKCEGSQTPYSYPLNELRDFLDHSAYLIQCRKSFQMVNVRRLIDDVMFQTDRPDKELNPQVAQLQNELERKRDELLTHRLRDSNQEEKPIINSQSAMEFEKEIFISYAWGGESEQFVNQLDETLQSKGIKIIRDKRDLGYKGLIKGFMKRIGRGKCAIAVISDKYLKSPNCMFELVQIAKNGKFYDRIFPIVLADAQIYNPIERIKYIKHWEDKIKELDEAMKGVSAANLQGFREEIDQYTEIRNTIAELTNLLKDMNTLTPDIHSKSDFEELLNAIAHRLDE